MKKLHGVSFSTLELLEPRIQFSAVSPSGAIALQIDSSTLVHTLARLSMPRNSIGATTVGSKAIFAGGLASDPDHPIYAFPVKTIDFYDSATGTWSAGTLPTAGYPAIAVTAGTKGVFTAGGPVDIYDGATGQWSSSRLSVERQNPSVAVVPFSAKVIFAGGLIVRGGNLNPIPVGAIDLYDASTNQWSTASLSQARAEIATATVGTKVLFAGGVPNFTGDGPSTKSNAVDIYDGATGQWSTAKLSVPRSEVAGAGVGNYAIFAGGIYYSKKTRGGLYSNAVDIYNNSTGRWTTAKLSSARVVISAATVGTKAVFIGPSFSNRGNAVDVFDSVTGRWSHTTLLTGKYQSAVAVLGTKAIFGGAGSGSIAMYDAATNVWSTVEFTSNSGQGGATVVGNQALFAGGNDSVDVFTDTTPTAVLSGSLTGRLGRMDSVTVLNTGDAALSGSYSINLYASRDRTLQNAVLAGSLIVPFPLPAGASATFGVRTILPKDTPAGTYHLLAAISDGTGHLTPIAAEDATFRVGEKQVAKPAGILDAKNRAGAFTRASHSAQQWT